MQSGASVGSNCCREVIGVNGERNWCQSFQGSLILDLEGRMLWIGRCLMGFVGHAGRGNFIQHKSVCVCDVFLLSWVSVLSM